MNYILHQSCENDVRRTWKSHSEQAVGLYHVFTVNAPHQHNDTKYHTGTIIYILLIFNRTPERVNDYMIVKNIHHIIITKNFVENSNIKHVTCVQYFWCLKIQLWNILDLWKNQSFRPIKLFECLIIRLLL